MLHFDHLSCVFWNACRDQPEGNVLGQQLTGNQICPDEFFPKAAKNGCDKMTEHL